MREKEMLCLELNICFSKIEPLMKLANLLRLSKVFYNIVLYLSDCSVVVYISFHIFKFSFRLKKIRFCIKTFSSPFSLSFSLLQTSCANLLSNGGSAFGHSGAQDG